MQQRQTWLERCNAMPYKAMSYQSNIIAMPCKANPSAVKPVQKQGSTKLDSWQERKEGLDRELDEWKTKEICARPRRRFSAGEMGEEGFEVRNEKTVGRLEPKPCFTWETLERAAFPHISSSSFSSVSDKVCHVLFYHDFTFYKQNDRIIKLSQNCVLHVKLWNMLLLSALERYLIVIFVITTLFLGLHF